MNHLFRFLLTCYFLLSISELFAQDWQAQVEDLWFNENKAVRLKEGDRMPDISFGETTNNKTGKTSFSELKGKLIILDFWNTGCSSCIASFPKMEILQKKFGDKIQIFLVNPIETQDQIEKALQARNELAFYKRQNKKVKLPDLPSIVDAKELSKLFPTRGVPHHIWIDAQGIVRMIGSSYNTYEEKVNDILSGKSVDYLKDDNGAPLFNPKFPYCNVIGAIVNPEEYNSFITSYCNDYATSSGGKVKNVIDSAKQTVRNTWVNIGTWDLYLDAFPGFKEKVKNSTIHSDFERNTIFLIDDTRKYTSLFPEKSSASGDFGWTDKDYIKARFCYEQVAPLNYSDNRMSEFMLSDLNTYFGKLNGTEVRMEKRKILCHVLQRTIKESNALNYGNDNIRMQIGALINNDFFKNSLKGKRFHFVDESGLGMKGIDTLNGNTVKSIEELKKLLNNYGLDIQQAEREIEFLVFREGRTIKNR